MVASNLYVGELTADEVYQESIHKGLSEAEASILVGSWILERYGKSKRVFSYKQDMDRNELACQLQFNRSFAHIDWIDGESVVQAEVTAGEEGFNLRFHRIEDDFDAMKTDVLKAFQCLADLREEAYLRFDELRNEINRINTDIHNCCHKDQPGFSLGNIAVDSGFIGTGLFLGSMKFNDQYLSMWRTSQGYMMLPNIYTAGTDIIKDHRVQNAGYVAKYFGDYKEVNDHFANQPSITKKAMLKKFGDATLSSGTNLRSSLEILPDDSRYDSLDKLVDDIAEREAAALRSRAATEHAVADVFGIEAEFENVKEAPVERFGAMPENARRILSSNGIETMGKLAKGNAKTILRLMKQNGIDASAGDVAEWQATAKTLILIR